MPKKNPMPTGYSETPLAKKLGIKTGQRTWHHNMPVSIAEEIEQDGCVPSLLRMPKHGLEMAHIFVTRRAELAEQLARLRTMLAPEGVLWVSWPKKAAKVETYLTDNVVRDEAFPFGFVDIKVCAVDVIWSGLKLVIRKSER